MTASAGWHPLAQKVAQYVRATCYHGWPEVGCPKCFDALIQAVEFYRAASQDRPTNQLLREAFVAGARWRNTKTTTGRVEPMIAESAIREEAAVRYAGASAWPDDAQMIAQFNRRAEMHAEWWEIEPVYFETLTEESKAYHLKIMRSDWAVVTGALHNREGECGCGFFHRRPEADHG